MVSAAVGLPASCGTARRVRNRMTTSPGATVMATVVCEECGASFQITHPMSLQDAALAHRQARWLVDRFVWDHIQESKHRTSIELPALAEAGKQA